MVEAREENGRDEGESQVHAQKQVERSWESSLSIAFPRFSFKYGWVSGEGYGGGEMIQATCSCGQSNVPIECLLLGR